jgi:uncharacterized membrane protein YcaP (DUF421 family)
MFANQYLNIALSSLAVYAFIIVAIRISGRKELTQLSVIDLVFILLISNAVQNAMVGPSTSLSGGLVAASTLFVANFILKELIYRFSKVSRLIEGQEIMLIYEGVVNRQNLKRAKISLPELEEALREHGVHEIPDVNLAVLEVDGNISVLSDNYQNKTVKKYRGHKPVNKSI